MDGVAVGLQPPQEAEGRDTDSQADEGDHDAHPGDDRQQQLVDAALVLGIGAGGLLSTSGLALARLTLGSARCWWCTRL